MLHGRDGVSIKLSALHPRFDLKSWPVLEKELLPKLCSLVKAAASKGIPLTVDAEEASRLDVTLLAFGALFESAECAGYEGLGLAVQAYQKRAPHVIDWLMESLRAQSGQAAHPVRLVKARAATGRRRESSVRRRERALQAIRSSRARRIRISPYLACAKQASC